MQKCECMGSWDSINQIFVRSKTYVCASIVQLNGMTFECMIWARWNISDSTDCSCSNDIIISVEGIDVFLNYNYLVLQNIREIQSVSQVPKLFYQNSPYKLIHWFIFRELGQVHEIIILKDLKFYIFFLKCTHGGILDIVGTSATPLTDTPLKSMSASGVLRIGLFTLNWIHWDWLQSAFNPS